MKLHDCVVWVEVDKSGTNPLHTVAKLGITELELRLVRHIFGHERVKDIKPAGEIEREERDELLRLCRRYGDQGGVYAEHGRELIRAVFNVDLHEFDNWLSSTVEQEETEREQRMREANNRFNLELAQQAALAAQANAAAIQQTLTPVADRGSAQAVFGLKPSPEKAAAEAEIE